VGQLNSSLKITGVAAISEAMDQKKPVTRILIQRGYSSEPLKIMKEKALLMGITTIEGSENDLRRMSDLPFDSNPPVALGLLERDPDADVHEIMLSKGIIWLLAGAQYPVNIGYAIRTVEVSGGSAVFVDAKLNSDGRKASHRASMKADRFIPVKWMNWEESIALAKRHEYTVIGIEDSGSTEPWDADLSAPCMLVIGGERHGIPEQLLNECDLVVRVPMGGFLPSYNLQAPLAVVATEALRQKRTNV